MRVQSKIDKDYSAWLKLIRQWYLFYNQKSTIAKQAVSQLETKIGQQAVAQLTQIFGGRNIAIISKCKNVDEALYSPGKGDLFVE